MRVVPCVSALAVREALLERVRDQWLVVLTDRTDDDLGAGVLSHLVWNRLRTPDPWDAVRLRFAATGVDPALTAAADDREIAIGLLVAAFPPSALRPVLDSWLFTLQSDATAADPHLAGRGQAAVDEAVEVLLEQRLAAVSVRTPAFAQALRVYRSAVTAGDGAGADALAAWLGGQPHVAAAAKRSAGIRANWTTSARWGSCRAGWKSSATPGIPGCCWCLMRWRRCSGSAVMSGTRP